MGWDSGVEVRRICVICLWFASSISPDLAPIALATFSTPTLLWAASSVTAFVISPAMKFDLGQGQRQIARSCGIGKTTVAEFLARFERFGLSWPQALELEEAGLEHRRYPPAPVLTAAERPEPDWSHIHQELRRKGVTLKRLWHEYRAAHPQGYGYGWFCERYGAWAGKLDVVMRQVHRAGEKLFVDYAEATWTQQLPDFRGGGKFGTAAGGRRIDFSVPLT
jgi:hypothetical protein